MLVAHSTHVVVCWDDIWLCMRHLHLPGGSGAAVSWLRAPAVPWCRLLQSLHHVHQVDIDLLVVGQCTVVHGGPYEVLQAGSKRHTNSQTHTPTHTLTQLT